ncbi:YpzG family protein [Solibacillus sp. MA9]|uniref:YpzG family protein n=1 Tax=Solibacillus palustris TaxID=2908203 RepID=A0ABS9UGY1_9BACL|nr:YpzG family protein [Solibacillus sp. MA9]MCH7323185.1 YpzG family protein [Solibacillus sp. MA9]
MEKVRKEKHKNWSKNKHQKSQVYGQSEVSFHNKLLRNVAKSKQL